MDDSPWPRSSRSAPLRVCEWHADDRRRAPRGRRLVLDNTSPRWSAPVRPTARRVSRDATITLTFSERMDSSSGESAPRPVRRIAGQLHRHRRRRADQRVLGPVIGSDRRALHAGRAFESSGVYTVVLRGEARCRRRKRPVLRSTTSSFVPTTDTLREPAGSRQRLITRRASEAVIRVTFSVAVARPSLVLRMARVRRRWPHQSLHR